MFKSPSSSSRNFISNIAKIGIVYTFVIGNIQSLGPLGENFDFFSPLGFDILTRHSVPKTPKIELHSVKALKRHLNEKNLTHGREVAAISKFNALIF